MCKCLGCGITLQNDDSLNIGYTNNIENRLCERCFKIKNYNQYSSITMGNNDYIKILKNIASSNDLVILVIDLFNISKKIELISTILNNDILLVLSKRDILPKSCYDKKFINYFNYCGLNIVDTEIISSKKNLNFDSLFEKINKYKKSNNVYVVGFTNAGKSTMINKLIYNYSEYDSQITTSNIPSTTLDSINVKVNDTLTLIDTPGIIDEGDITNYLSSADLKKVQPNGEIKPITYQIKGMQTLQIDSFAYLNLENVNVTLYISNSISIKRLFKNISSCNMIKHSINVKKGNDIVIQGLGFINVSTDCTIIIYTTFGVSVYTRKELI